MGREPRGEQFGDRLVEPDLLAAGHLGQQGGGEHLCNRPDLEYGVGVRWVGGALRRLPVGEAEGLVAEEQPDDQTDIPRRADISFG
jgi:hypothetical protein